MCLCSTMRSMLCGSALGAGMLKPLEGSHVPTHLFFREGNNFGRPTDLISDQSVLLKNSSDCITVFRWEPFGHGGL